MVAAATYSSEVEQSLNEFCATRARTLAMARGLTQEQLDFVPGPNRWSAGEVLDHIVLAEGINNDQIARLIALKKAGLDPNLDLSFSDLNISIAYVPRSLLSVFEVPLTFINMLVPNCLRDYLTRHRVVPFQNPDAAAPRPGRTVSTLNSDLTDSLRKTEVLFQRDPGLDYGQMVLRHPLLGRYNVPGLLRFMAAHEQRHQSQINNIMASPQFPAGEFACVL
jgi:DinB superfamily